MKTIAVIPARGGSKGLPRKNVMHLCGKPLLAWTIEAVKDVQCIERVVVSTDNDEIAKVAISYGAEVVFRPENLSDDHSPSELAILHVLDFLEQNENYSPDLVLFLQCTSPLTLPCDIQGTLDQLTGDDADCCFTVANSHHFLWKDDTKTGNTIGVNHDRSKRQMRQEMDSQYIETGAVYAFKSEGFKQARHRFFGNLTKFVVPEKRRYEIDDLEDFKLVEYLMQSRINSQRVVDLPKNLAAIILDFDGVLTDNKVLVMQDGTEGVSCNRSDGLAISRFRYEGIPVVVISTEENPVVRARCDKLGIECYNGVDDKLTLLLGWAKQNKVDLARSIYVGNDVNDASCLKEVGYPVVVNDAVPAVKSLAKIVLNTNGGYGAIRELMSLIYRDREF